MVHGRAHLLLLLLAALCRQYSLRTQCKGDAEKAAEPDLGEIPLRLERRNFMFEGICSYYGQSHV